MIVQLRDLTRCKFLLDWIHRVGAYYSIIHVCAPLSVIKTKYSPFSLINMYAKQDLTVSNVSDDETTLNDNGPALAHLHSGDRRSSPIYILTLPFKHNQNIIKEAIIINNATYCRMSTENISLKARDAQKRTKSKIKPSKQQTSIHT
ncbi:hypothetical protein O6H91_11G015000 [Diphasiastrum complanatum]|uniref:Uncharacterized protein n=1 Tax=Diphasiastrum complanatum TaxID=34168 RepID=A0ACC2C6K1_DIPCM|nr:hypothetical protein O6H91_11G015000 [Diphasiastrum complanatum]